MLIGLPAALALATPLCAQGRGAIVTGRVTVASDGSPIARALVSIEGTRLSGVSDTAGRFRIAGVPPGPQVLLARFIGYAPARLTLTVPPTGTITQDIEMTRRALEMAEIQVTADPTSRAAGELATASVIGREAVANQTAASVAGVLELLPGVPIQPPGLETVQQYSLRAVPTSEVVGVTAGGPGSGAVGSLGTSFIIDGVPVSNNANLQSTGPRGEAWVTLPTTSGAGIDLRQIPAATIERVEVIRGVPSARFGDLTEGVVVLDTRAGAVTPELTARADPRTIELGLVGGRQLGAHALAATGDVARTQVSPGVTKEIATRTTLQLAHRWQAGGPGAGPNARGVILDSRVGFYGLVDDNPERPEIAPGYFSTNHDLGLRVQERARFPVGTNGELAWTGALNYTQRRSTAQANLVRGATPFTDRLTEGTQEGHYVLGQYLSRYDLDGNERNLYSRLELGTPGAWLHFDHWLRAGLELRREWNSGPGYQFDIEFPPQVTFNGVNGYDRPRPFDAVPPMATTALYLDDRLVRGVFGNVTLEVQAGLRLDLLHKGSWWTSAVRDAALQPRINAQLAPFPWLRLRGAWGQTAKSPTLAQLSPAPQYFDVVNVNYYANDPAERLAILTTFIRDPSNPDLGFSIGHKGEAGIELSTPHGDAALAVTVFQDKTTGGIGYLRTPTFLLRDNYALTDTTLGDGQPPTVVFPAASTDTVPVLVDLPANILTLDSKGVEGTVSLPELRPLGLRLEVTGAWVKTSFFQDGPDFGSTFSDFQLDATIPRSPYWASVTNTGERAIFTYRLIHHEPRFGLVLTAIVQHYAHETRQNLADTDTLAWDGYITRTGELVPVPAEERGDPQYNDLHVSRSGLITTASVTPADWFASLEVSKTLPAGGHLRFYAYNVLDRLGKFDTGNRSPRQFPGTRFGLEMSFVLDALASGGFR